MATARKSISELELRIGYTFKNKTLLLIALTHSSYSNEMKGKNKQIECNERLEFLGDSVLSVVVSGYLFKNYKDSSEGELTCMRAEVVCERALSAIARKIELGSYISLGHGEEQNNGRERKSILADAFEALLAAMYIDGGAEGMANVEQFLIPMILPEFEEIEAKGKGKDYKTALQQLVQQAGGEILEYIVVDERGPDHMKVFSVEARLNSNTIGTGEGRTKREAEQKAAKLALALFGQK